MNHPQLITFTRARDKSDFWENGEHSKKRTPQVTERSIAGEEARSFYESLLTTGGEQPVSSRHRKRKATRFALEGQEAGTRSVPVQSDPAQEDAEQRMGHQLLKCSQDGDLKGLKKLVEKENCNINFRDTYYWTAMMCAAYGGRSDVVGYLLKRGAAWVGVCETKGKDALTLAEEAGHRDVVRLLQQSLSGYQQESTSRKKPLEKRYCEVCKTHYQEDTVETHERSTVHLFNKRKKPPPTYYAIPEHNVGFKMMLKEGWDRESGLGPGGTGRKFPVQTVLKRDQKGLGFQTDQKPKVTHFAPNDPLAVARPEKKYKRVQRVSTISRKEERRKEARDKAWERDLRTYMNIDL
ncbi:G patch domain and ankyrin repeat-containing protein 1 [Rhinophrynus dorsalis]